MNSTSPTLATKPHFQILDGLRGVAAITVVVFHTFEAYAESSVFKQHLNHGYLAVDFFFLLSGFVIAFAYDDRWDRWPRMSQWEFYKRRLIRLQPMVVMGSLLGAALFYTQSGTVFPLIAATPLWKLLLVTLIGCTLIPILPSMDIRGWQEMHPLDGPAWSLFFEYLANLAYALGLRKLSNRALALVVFLAGAFLTHYLLFGPRGDVIGGWSIDPTQLHIGFARLLYPFFAGILLQRLGKRIRIPHAFLVCSLLVVGALAFPRLGGPHHLWLNGLYESACILLLFPLIVAIGAGSQPEATPRLAKLLGDLSYPLYITHYPLIYLYTAWTIQNHIPPAEGAWVGALLLLTAIAIAYASLKLYDEPVRAWLTRRYLAKPRTTSTARL